MNSYEESEISQLADTMLTEKAINSRNKNYKNAAIIAGTGMGAFLVLGQLYNAPINEFIENETGMMLPQQIFKTALELVSFCALSVALAKTTTGICSIAQQINQDGQERKEISSAFILKISK